MKYWYNVHCASSVIIIEVRDIEEGTQYICTLSYFNCVNAEQSLIGSVLHFNILIGLKVYIRTN